MGNGTLAINNTISTGGGTLNCAEGMCSGSGTIAGDLNNAGTVSPGNSPGLMTVEGDFAQSSAGTVLIELAGTTAGIEHDVLQVDGEASLGGTLEVSLLDGFSPGNRRCFCDPGIGVDFRASSIRSSYRHWEGI